MPAPVARSTGNQPPELRQREIHAARDVALARTPSFQREHVGGRDILNWDDIHAAAECCGHAPAEQVDDDLAGRGRPPVARSDWRRREHGDHRDLGASAARSPTSFDE